MMFFFYWNWIKKKLKSVLTGFNNINWSKPAYRNEYIIKIKLMNIG